MRQPSRLRAVLLACSIFAPSATALAQEATAPQAPTSGLNDIVVTAQRRSESLQRAALAVSAVSGDALATAGITRPTDLGTVVPVLQIAPAAGPYTLFYLRGVGNFNGNALSDPAIAFNFDGVYVGRPSATTGFFYDIDRIEVLKGPQGTLYGRNATGGAINVITTKPRLNETSGAASVEYGNYNAVNVDAALNLPLGQNAALRAAGTFVRHDGYMRDGTDDQNDLSGRLSLRWEPSAAVSVNIVADAFRQRGKGQGGTPVALGIDGRPGYLSDEGKAFVATQPNLLLGQSMTPLSQTPFLHNNFWGVSATVDWRTALGTFTVIPAYREGSLNFRSDVPGFYIWQRERDYQGSLEARLTSDDARPLRYLLGGFYYRETNRIPFYYIYQQANVNLVQYRQDDENAAAFGRLTYAVTPSIRLTAGARYTSEVKRLDGTLAGNVRACVLASCPDADPLSFSLALDPPNFNPAAGAGTVTLPVFVDNSGASGRRAHFDRATFRLGADWDVTDRNLLYASYESGFKSGGFFFTSDEGVYRPETISAFTLGSKNRFWGQRIQINAELFYWIYRNQQISHLVNDSAGQAIFATQNVGRATYKGAEIDARARLATNTELSADIQYLDARYSTFVYDAPNTNGGVSNGTGCPSLAVSTNYTIDCSGFRPPYAPEWTINLGGQQTIPLQRGDLVADVHAHWQSTTLTGLEFVRDEYQKAYWLVDAQLTYRAPGDRFTLGVYGRNLFDATTIANSGPTAFTIYTSAALNPPRTYGVRASVKF
ncbi:hypothetical protein GCM10019060_03570 [Novosphingobium pokkalii]|nr:hypothetical protein GCM10019060_03570 [Novosphingobium pokkalii]